MSSRLRFKLGYCTQNLFALKINVKFHKARSKQLYYCCCVNNTSMQTTSKLFVHHAQVCFTKGNLPQFSYTLLSLLLNPQTDNLCLKSCKVLSPTFSLTVVTLLLFFLVAVLPLSFLCFAVLSLCVPLCSFSVTFDSLDSLVPA